MKILLLIIIAAAIYAVFNWDAVSPKIDAGLERATELKQKADDFQEDIQQKADDTKDKLDDVEDRVGDAKDKMDDANNAFEALIDKVK